MNLQFAGQIAEKKKQGFALGIALPLMLALLAKYASAAPILSIMGQLVIAILLGMIWRATLGVPGYLTQGISFTSKKLLRYGIILLGMRLSLKDILQAGPKVVLIALVCIGFTICTVLGLARLFKVESRLGLLTACGTAICGAAAVVAIAPQLKASDEETAISAATVAILGTIFTLMYTLLYPVLTLTPLGYGIFSGATLHEIAHVIAATEPAGKQAVDLAVIVKLTRVTMLVPIAVIIGIWTNHKERKANPGSRPSNWRSVPVPWFILGFLLMSTVNTLHIIPEAITDKLVFAAYFLIAMAMAGLGLNVDMAAFRRMGLKAFGAGLIGSVLLSGLGFLLVKIWGLD
ncbi:YeiH family protein [Paenibacillus sp. FSL K6-1096]|uniref:YeiH family protein n=1 Tax=Paenibacillus sp. FSL K6-1096 TaxID=2921460 RepID=UPI0030EB203C